MSPGGRGQEGGRNAFFLGGSRCFCDHFHTNVEWPGFTVGEEPESPKCPSSPGFGAVGAVGCRNRQDQPSKGGKGEAGVDWRRLEGPRCLRCKSARRALSNSQSRGPGRPLPGLGWWGVERRMVLPPLQAPPPGHSVILTPLPNPRVRKGQVGNLSSRHPLTWPTWVTKAVGCHTVGTRTALLEPLLATPKAACPFPLLPAQCARLAAYRQLGWATCPCQDSSYKAGHCLNPPYGGPVLDGMRRWHFLPRHRPKSPGRKQPGPQFLIPQGQRP